MNRRTYLKRLLIATPLISVAVIFFSIPYAGLPLLFGLILRAFFDTLTGAAPAAFGIATLVILYFVNRIALQLAELLLAGTSALHYYVIIGMLRRNTFRLLMKTRGYLHGKNSGQLINRIDEDSEELGEPIWTITYMAGEVLATMVAIIIMVRINALLTLVAVMPILIAIFIVQLMGHRLQAYREAAREASGQVSELLTELLNGVQAVKIASAEDSVMRRFDALSEDRRRTVVRDRTFSRLVESLNGVAQGLATGLILLFAAGFVQRGAFTIGDFALFTAYIAFGGISIAGLAKTLANLTAKIKQADVSMERLTDLVPPSVAGELLATDSLHLHGPLPTTALAMGNHRPFEGLEVNGLTYRYPSGGQGIHDISFTLTPGSLTVITGRIGSGKTTLLEALLGLLPATAGLVSWNGRVVGDPATFFVPPNCAYTPQVPRLFSESVRENILLGIPEEEADLPDALHTAVLENDIERLDDHLDTIVGPRGVRLSGGQIQRTAAARMFVRKPSLLLFDDLSSALDVETEKQMWNRLFTDGRVSTYLAVSHRPNVLQQADQIIVMAKGRVVDRGALPELLERCLEMREIWNRREA